MEFNPWEDYEQDIDKFFHVSKYIEYILLVTVDFVLLETVINNNKNI